MPTIRLAIIVVLLILPPLACAAGADQPRSRGKEALVPLKTVTDIDWAVRVIPLPHEMKLSGGLAARADRIAAIAPPDSAPAVITALEILRSFALGGPKSPCQIRLVSTTETGVTLPPGLARRLSAAPNADQAYAIVGRQTGEGAAELVLVANTPQGLLYATRTLQQLVAAPRIAPDTALVLPLGEVADWPDIPERGEWGGNSDEDLPWMARWKMNVVEIPCGTGVDEHGRPTISFNEAKLVEGARLGLKVVPIITHLEQLPRGGLKGWEDCYNTPDAERAKRSDYHPSLCMSNPRTWDLIAQWLKQIAALPGVSDVMVWLSEERTPCCCQQCNGKEPYGLEVAAVMSGFRQAQGQVSPKLRLRLLTTQGSFPVNDKILQAVPPDVGVSYYDGGRTYDSSHSPMIYPLLEDFARSGRWLGVYPQLTNAWRTVFPWTGPQFVRARMQEFASKRLSCVIGYVVPSNRFHEFNVIAAAEWSWNPGGRSPRDFARAYAHAAGIADVEAFADWAQSIGPIGWDIAGSRLFLRMIYSPAMALGGDAPLDHRFEGGPEVLSDEQIQNDLAQAQAALAIARRLDLPDAVEETELDIASLKLLRGLYWLSHIRADAANVSPAQVAAAAQSLDMLDRCAAAISTRLRQWGERVCARPGESIPSRLIDTVQAPARTANSAREILGRPLGITDPHPEVRYRELGQWSAADFATGPRQVLTFDATACVTEPGDYVVCLDFVESAYGTDVRGVSIVAMEGEARRQVLPSADPVGGVSMWERWRDARVSVPKILPDCRYLVQIEAQGLPADAPPDRRTCAGRVTIGRNWDEAAVGGTFFAE